MTLSNRTGLVDEEKDVGAGGGTAQIDKELHIRKETERKRTEQFRILSRMESIAEAQSENDSPAISPEYSAVNSLRFSISHTANGYVVLNKSEFKNFKDDSNPFDTKFSEGWKLGDNYKFWAQGFLTLNQKLFEQYNEILEQTAIATLSKDIQKINSLSNSMVRLFNRLTTSIQYERPQWRFKYFIIPVSLGWPFHREARSFANLLTKELESTFKRSLEFISSSKDSIIARLQTEITVVSSRSSIERRMSEEAKLDETQEKCVIHDVSTSPVEEKFIDPSIRHFDFLVNWAMDASKFQEENFKGSLEFLDSKESAEKTLADILNLLNEEEGRREAFENTAFSLHQLLEILLLNPVLTTAKLHKAYDQIKLLSKLLKVVVYAKTENFEQDKNEFDTFCKVIFDRKNARNELSEGYSSHGFMRDSASINRINDSMIDVNPSSMNYLGNGSS